jgi:hypothetical protein
MHGEYNVKQCTSVRKKNQLRSIESYKTHKYIENVES